MYDQVVIGVDGRDGGRDAVALARRLAAPHAHYTLVHVTVATAVSPENTGIELEVSNPERLTRAFAAELKQCGEGATIIREHASSVGGGLQAVAERVGADLVVVGACRRKGLERLLAGDDALSTVQRSTSAVAVATPRYREAGGPVRSVGVACDLQPPSAVAVAHAGLLAHRLNATVLAMGVVEPQVHTTAYGVTGVPPEDPQAAIESARRRLVEFTDTEVTVAYGSAGDELARLSERVDLLVCGSRRHGPAGRVLLGSTSVWLIRNAHCPVLVAPRNDERAVQVWKTPPA